MEVAPCMSLWHDMMLQRGAPCVCLLWSKHVFFWCMFYSCTYLRNMNIILQLGRSPSWDVWESAAPWGSFPRHIAGLVFNIILCFIYHCINHTLYLISLHTLLTPLDLLCLLVAGKFGYNLCALTHDNLNNWLKWCAKQTKGHLPPSAAESHFVILMASTFAYLDRQSPVFFLLNV